MAYAWPMAGLRLAYAGTMGPMAAGASGWWGGGVVPGVGRGGRHGAR